MEEWQKTYIKTSMSALLDDTTCHTSLAARLVSNGVLSGAEQNTLDGKKDNADKVQELYRVVMTKDKGYESLIEALNAEMQTGAVKTLLKGFIDRQNQMTIGRNKMKHYTIGQATKTLDDFAQQTVENLAFCYKQNMENAILNDPTDAEWNDRHLKLEAEIKQHLVSSLGNFTLTCVNIDDRAEELDDRINTIFCEIKALHKSLEDIKKQLIQKYKATIIDDMDCCKSVEEFCHYHTTNLEDIMKYFQKQFTAHERKITEKYENEIVKLANDHFSIQKKCFERRVQNDDRLDKQTIDKAIEMYDREMDKHLDKAGTVSDTKLQTNHEKALRFTMGRCAQNKKEAHKKRLREILEKRLKLCQNKNDMARSQADPAIGIDLGTVNCCVAVYLKGKIHMIPSQTGKASIPSYVAFEEYGKLTIGEAAKENAFRNPINTIYDAKRIIGRSMTNLKEVEDIDLWPFTIVDQQGNPKYKVYDEKYDPEDISAELLHHLRQQAEKFLNCTVRKACITVPAYFNDDQRQATMRAAEQANLTVLSLLNEPIAAGIAYGWERLGDTPTQALIFDLGGGTFDVAVLQVDSTKIHVVACDGDTHLGGNDFDNQLVQYCVEYLNSTTGFDLLKQKESADERESFGAKQSLQKLHEACEKCKRNLSFHEVDFVSVSSIGNGYDLNIQITRAELEDMCSELFKRMIFIVDRVLEKSKINTTEIDEIILIGGATRIPKIQTILQNHFDQISLTYSINPDEAVAYGAAVKAALKNGKKFNGMLVKDIQDVVPMSVGIECITNGKAGRFWPIISKNSKYPTTGEEVFSTSKDNQKSGHISVYQGENKIAAENHTIGDFIYDGIPPDKANSQKIRVRMTLNENGILELEVSCESTSKHVNKTFEVKPKALHVVKRKCSDPQIGC